jgi:hypothetical protein
MTNSSTPRKTSHFPGGIGIGKSIFPIFNINVPMPKDTAVPGSYNKPVQQSSSNIAASKPVKAAE